MEDDRLVRVLLVEDDEDDVVLVRDLLSDIRGIGYHLDWANGYGAALEAADRGPHDVYLIDYRLGSHSGLDLLRRLVADGCAAPIIMLTGQGDRDLDLESMRAGAADYLVKGQFDASLLERSLRYALERKRHEEELRRLHSELERKVEQRTEALRQSEERWRNLAEALPQLVWATPPDGCCDYLSGQWADYTGIPVEQLLGYRWLSLLHPDDRERTLACWMTAVQDRGAYDLEYRIRGADGQYRWFKTRGTPVRDAAGAIVQWFGTCTDIEDTKKLEAALKEADQRKDEFLATLAHELRNPLAPIRNALQIQRLAGSGPAVRQAQDLIERQVQQLVRLVDDLLDVSRITRGKVELRTERVELAAVVGMAVETSGPLIEASGHRLSIRLPAARLWLEADPTRLAQVLSNLLNNSAKYTEPGGRIELSAEQDGAEVAVRIKDTGVGIPAEMLPRVFDLFTQVDRSLERSQGGLGIGLTLVRSLVQLHGGVVEAHSDGPGRGSEFVVRLPLARQEARPSPNGAALAEQGAKSAHFRILVVDDSRDAAESLAMVLRLHGHEARVAYGGPEALQAADEFRPRVVLLDIGMPGLNGYEVARRLRERPELAGVVLIALTGWGQEADRRRSAAAGFDRHLVKPVDPEELQKVLAAVAAPSHV